LPLDIEFNPIAFNLIGMLSVGLGLAFYVLDRQVRASCIFGLFLCSIGFSVLAGANFLRDAESNLRFFTLLMSLPTALSFVLGPEWIREVRSGIPAGDYDTRFGDRLTRLAQLGGVLYFIASLVYPEWHYQVFIGGISGSITVIDKIKILVIGGPLIVSIPFAGLALIITFRRKVNLAERRRLASFGLAVPFLGLGLIAGPEHATYVMLIGELILIVGAIQYHMLKAQRGDFMERFLPSQVVNALDDNGNQLNLETGRQVITVVACDLRKFTPYAEAHDSAHVIQLLRDYYKMVGEAAASCGATIKDYAGDGVLMLVGAPIEFPDHADRGLRLAKEILDRSKELLATWNSTQSSKHQLGIGVGVATGEASVGVVGAERLEYAAVGPAINRASRLCDKAKDGLALIGPDTYAANTEFGGLLKKGPRERLKGMSEPVQTWIFAT